MRGQTGVNPLFVAAVLSEEVKEDNEETKKNKIKLKMAVTFDAHICMISSENEMFLKSNFL